MAIDLFRLIHGIDIQSDNLASNAYILQGTGVPGGDSGVQDDAPIGSIYMRTDANTTPGQQNLQLYYKWQDTNSVADWKLVADKEFVESVAKGLSWREPAKAMDSVTTTTASMPSNPGGTVTIDGVTIGDGDRVLFSALTDGGGPNVYVYQQTTGTWVEDPNQESDGDALMVQQGTTHADQQWVYNGTTWVQFGSAANAAELGYIRAFIGKDAVGAELPAYTQENAIIDGQSLETAIDKVDIALGNGDITNVGNYWALSGDLAFTGTNGANGTLTVTSALNQLNNAVGNRTYTNDYVVADGESVAVSIDKLDTAVGMLQQQGQVSSGTNQTGTVVADTIPLTAASEIKWLVQMRETANPSKRRAAEVHAIHDGTSVDHTRYAELKLNNGVTGFGVNVAISGSNLELRVSASVAYDYVVKRVAYSSF